MKEILTGVAYKVVADDSDVILNVAGVPVAVHLYVGGGDAGAAEEKPSGAKDEGELKSLAVIISPAVSCSH